MEYSFGTPPRSPTNIIVWPVLGFQAGEMHVAFENVSRLGWLPLESVTYSSGLPSIEEEKTILAPSGDHGGVVFVPLKRGKEITVLESMEYMQMCASVI